MHHLARLAIASSHYILFCPSGRRPHFRPLVPSLPSISLPPESKHKTTLSPRPVIHGRVRTKEEKQLTLRGRDTTIRSSSRRAKNALGRTEWASNRSPKQSYWPTLFCPTQSHLQRNQLRRSRRHRSVGHNHLRLSPHFSTFRPKCPSCETTLPFSTCRFR